jgi:calcium-dependent protein kinase
MVVVSVEDIVFKSSDFIMLKHAPISS